LLLVTDALEALGVTYCVGGSFASSTYGEPRATRDVDILAALPAAKAGLVAARLEPEFFIQLSDLRDAIALAPSLQDDPMHRASCNLVHRSSFFRVDLFIASGRPYERAQFARRIPQTVALNPDRHAYFVSPEDIILIKLDWYRMAQGVLDRQWSRRAVGAGNAGQHARHRLPAALGHAAGDHRPPRRRPARGAAATAATTGR
jgi:hypothetical protein